MNIFSQESQDLVTAKTCGSKADEKKTRYAFSKSFHSLCLDKKGIIEAEIQACDRLSKYAKNDSEKLVADKEIAELRMALDLLT